MNNTAKIIIGLLIICISFPALAEIDEDLQYQEPKDISEYNIVGVHLADIINEDIQQMWQSYAFASSEQVNAVLDEFEGQEFNVDYDHLLNEFHVHQHEAGGCEDSNSPSTVMFEDGTEPTTDGEGEKDKPDTACPEGDSDPKPDDGGETKTDGAGADSSEQAKHPEKLHYIGLQGNTYNEDGSIKSKGCHSKEGSGMPESLGQAIQGLVHFARYWVCTCPADAEGKPKEGDHARAAAGAMIGKLREPGEDGKKPAKKLYDKAMKKKAKEAISSAISRAEGARDHAEENGASEEDIERMNDEIDEMKEFEKELDDDATLEDVITCPKSPDQGGGASYGGYYEDATRDGKKTTRMIPPACPHANAPVMVEEHVGVNIN